MKKQHVKENQEMLAEAKKLFKNASIDKSKIVNLRGVERIQYLQPFNKAVKTELQKKFPGITESRIRTQVSAAFRSIWMNK